MLKEDLEYDVELNKWRSVQLLLLLWTAQWRGSRATGYLTIVSKFTFWLQAIISLLAHLTNLAHSSLSSCARKNKKVILGTLVSLWCFMQMGSYICSGMSCINIFGFSRWEKVCVCVYVCALWPPSLNTEDPSIYRMIEKHQATQENN